MKSFRFFIAIVIFFHSNRNQYNRGAINADLTFSVCPSTYILFYGKLTLYKTSVTIKKGS